MKRIGIVLAVSAIAVFAFFGSVQLRSPITTDDVAACAAAGGHLVDLGSDDRCAEAEQFALELGLNTANADDSLLVVLSELDAGASQVYCRKPSLPASIRLQPQGFPGAPTAVMLYSYQLGNAAIVANYANDYHPDVSAAGGVTVLNPYGKQCIVVASSDGGNPFVRVYAQ